MSRAFILYKHRKVDHIRTGSLLRASYVPCSIPDVLHVLSHVRFLSQNPSEDRYHYYSSFFTNEKTKPLIV